MVYPSIFQLLPEPSSRPIELMQALNPGMSDTWSNVVNRTAVERSISVSSKAPLRGLMSDTMSCILFGPLTIFNSFSCDITTLFSFNIQGLDAESQLLPYFPSFDAGNDLSITNKNICSILLYTVFVNISSNLSTLSNSPIPSNSSGTVKS